MSNSPTRAIIRSLSGITDFVNYATSSVANLTLLATPATQIARWDFNDTNNLIVTAPIAPPAAARLLF